MAVELRIRIPPHLAVWRDWTFLGAWYVYVQERKPRDVSDVPARRCRRLTFSIDDQTMVLLDGLIDEGRAEDRRGAVVYALAWVAEWASGGTHEESYQEQPESQHERAA